MAQGTWPSLWITPSRVAPGSVGYWEWEDWIIYNRFLRFYSGKKPLPNDGIEIVEFTSP